MATSDTRPRTRNGVLIRAGMTVWVAFPNGTMHCERVASVRRGVVKSSYAGTMFRGGVIVPEQVSSTPAAARAAVMNVEVPDADWPRPRPRRPAGGLVQLPAVAREVERGE